MARIPQIQIVYLHQSINPTSMVSVPRLLGVLAEQLQGAGVEEVKVRSFHRPINLDIDFTPLASVVFRKVFYNRFASSWLRRLGDYLAVKKIVHSGIKKDSVFIACTIDSVKALLNHVPPSRVIYWLHSYPGTEGVQQFGDLLRQPINLVTPSEALYRQLWKDFGRFGMSCFWYHIPQPNLQFYVDEVSFPIDLALLREMQKGRILLHAGGKSESKGLHLIRRALVGVEEQEKLWLLSIGSEFERREWGSFSEVVLPRISPSQLKQVIKIADLCLFPSLIFDVAPLLVTEFKEMRKPIIASDVGGVRECLGASSAKYIRNPNSVLEWRHTIINSLGIGQEREDCSSASDASEGTVPVEEWVEIWLELFAEISDIHHQNENGR